MARNLTITDLTRRPGEVATGLPEWRRGDHDEAVLATLELSAANVHARAYVAWTWFGVDHDGTGVWILPVHTRDVERFAPRGPALVIARSFAAASAVGADPESLRVFDWMGMTGLAAPGLDDDVSAIALTDVHAAPARGAVQRLPADVGVDSSLELALGPVRSATGGLGGLGRRTRTHPVRLIPALLSQQWGLEEDAYPDSVAEMLRHRGFDGPPEPPPEVSLAIDDDPCPNRRLTRRLLRRMLHKGKIGAGYHTAFDHLAHGVEPDQRALAYDIGESLLRAGLLGEKPSVGQRHVYLRREALPAIHALISRGEADHPTLAVWWTAPAPSAAQPD